MKLKSRQDLSLCYVNRQANYAAHRLARAPSLLNCPNVFESPPIMLLKTLVSDLS